MREKRKINVMAVISLILSILSILCCCLGSGQIIRTRRMQP